MSTAMNSSCDEAQQQMCEGRSQVCFLDGSGAPHCAGSSAPSSEWSQWWLIPVLIIAVVVLERVYSSLRKVYLQRTGQVDTSNFSALHPHEADDLDGQLDEQLEMDTFDDSDEDEEEKKKMTEKSMP
jgi:hypothetical protein